VDWTLDDWFVHWDEVAQIGENGALRSSMKHVRAVLNIKGTPGPKVKETLYYRIDLAVSQGNGLLRRLTFLDLGQMNRN